MRQATTAAPAARRTKAAKRGAAPRAKPKKSESLTERVYQLLRAEILTCSLEPGQEISEAELAARFAVSKTPVREALATLRLEGLVRTFPRRGYQVVPMTFGDLNELFDLRMILEAGAAELACQRISDAELDALQKLAEVVYDRAEQPSLKRFIQANRDFHVAIAKASGNERLFAILGKQMDELERFFYLGARRRDINRETQDDHLAIVDILRKRDPAAARKIMLHHNEVTRQGLFNALSQSRNLGSINL